MFAGFFLSLRKAEIPVSLREYLDLLAAMDRGLAAYDVEEFYYLARAALVKDERHIDRFDQVFGRSEEHTSELQSLMRISYAVFCLKKKNKEIAVNVRVTQLKQTLQTLTLHY